MEQISSKYIVQFTLSNKRHRHRITKTRLYWIKREIFISSIYMTCNFCLRNYISIDGPYTSSVQVRFGNDCSTFLHTVDTIVRPTGTRNCG